MATIRVVGSPNVITAEVGSSLLENFLRAGVPISTSCGARAACGLCRVTVLQGMQCLSPLLPTEVHHLGSVAKIVGARLSCQARIVADGDIEVEVPVPVDVAERKREKARRQMLERASAPGGLRDRRSSTSQPGGGPPDRRSQPRPEQIEWRPRKLDKG